MPQSDWKEFTAAARQRWTQLSEDDLDRAQSNEELLIGRLKELYGMSSEEAKQQVATMRQNLQAAVRGGEMYGGADK